MIEEIIRRSELLQKSRGLVGIDDEKGWKQMSYRVMTLGALAVAACFSGIVWLNAAEGPGSATAEDDKLKQMLARIEKLEARVRHLENQAGVVLVPQSRGQMAWAPRATDVAPYQPLPEGWRREEFNGQPYYIVPLESPVGAEPLRTAVPAKSPHSVAK